MSKTSTSTSILFSEFESEKLSLPNRIIMAPMTRMMCHDHIPGEEIAAYYRRRIEGGVGLILSECTFVDHPAGNAYPDAPAFFGEAALAGWKKVVDAVHQAGGKFMPQIWHAGPARQPGSPPEVSVPGYGPMEIREGETLLCRAMSKTDIDAVVQAFAQAALDAKNIGCDGIEVHGAHSFLIDSFLWKESNQRNDEYGGSIENRTRFAVEVVRAIREKVGPDFPILFRYSQWKQSDYEARIAETPEELAAILMPLVEAGVDIFDPSTRRFWEPAFAGSELSLAAWTKKITGKPVIAVGSVGIDQPLDLGIFAGASVTSKPVSVVDAEQAMLQGDFDLLAVGRALLADANWANKIKDNDVEHVVAFSSESLAELV